MANSKPTLLITGGLDKQNTKKQIQAQLDKLGGELKLTIGVDKSGAQDITKQTKGIKDLTQANKGYVNGLNNLLHLMKTKQITDDKALANLNKLRQNQEFANLTQKQQVALVSAMEKANNNYTKSVDTATNIQKKYNDEIKKTNQLAEDAQSKQWQGRFQESIKSMTSTPDALVQMRKFYQEQEKLANVATGKNTIDTRLEDRRAERYLDIKNLADISKKESEILLKNIKKYQLTKQQKQEAEGYLKVLKSIEVTEEMSEKQLKAQARAIQLNKKELQTVFSDVRATGRGSLNFGLMFESALKSMTIWMSASTVFFQTIHAVQGGVQTIFDFDKAMTELKKVSEDSNESLDAFGKTAEAIGVKVGRTSIEVVNATSDFVKMGYSLQQSAKLAQDALVLTNVGDGFRDVGEASEALVTTLKGFNLNASESTHIIDSLNELSNKYAVNSVDLAEALKRSSAVMAQSGNTLDETLALYTAGIEVLQSPEKVSRGISTISQRLRGLSEDGEKVAGLTPKLQKAFDQYANGIKITKDDGGLRSTYDILVDLSKVWGTLSEKNRQYLGEQIAGKDQIKVLASLLQNQKVLLQANTVSLESNGSAAKENAIYMQSLEGKVKDFNRTVENLWKNTINSDSIKQIVSLGTEFVKVADSIGLMNLAVTILASVLIIKLVPAINFTNFSLTGLVLNIAKMIPLIFSLEGAVIAVAGAWIYLSYKQGEFIKAQSDATQKMNEANQASQQSVDTAHRLIESISDLNGVQKLNEQQQSRINSVTKELQKLYPNIFSNLDTEKNKVGALVEGYNALQKAAIQADIARAKTEMNAAKSAYDKVMATTKLASGQGRTAQANARFGLGSVDFSKAVNATNNAEIKATLDRYYAANDAYNKSKDQLSGYNKVTIADFKSESTGSGNAYSPSKTSSSSTSKSSPYLSNLNLQYQELEKNIALTTQALKDNQNKLSNTENEKEKIALIQKEIELNKKLQTQYADIAKAKRAEMKSIQSQLNALGLGVSIDKEDNVTVKNWKKINSLSEDNRKLADDLIGKMQSLSSEVKGYGDSWSDANNKIISDNKQINDILKEQREEKTKQLTEIENLISDMIKQGYKDEIEIAKDLIKKAKEQLDIRLKQLEAEKELADFNKDRAKSEKEINQISSKMVSLQTAVSQGDLKAKAEYDKLAEDKANLQESLDDKINERGFELTKERLQNEYDAFEKTKNDEIDTLEAKLNDSKNISKRTYDAINNYISGKSSSLYSDLIAWNSKYGTGMDSDIISKWQTAIGLIDTYNSKLSGMGSTAVSYEEYKSGLETGKDKASIIAQMKANGAQWATANATKKAELNKANIALASSIGYTYDSKTGSYFNAQGAKLYDGNGGLKPLGQLGIMGENVKEWVLKDNNIADLAKVGVQQFLNTLPNFMNGMQPTFTSSGSPNINVVINGDVSDKNIGRITDTLKQTALSVTQNQLESFRQRGMKPSTRIR